MERIKYIVNIVIVVLLLGAIAIGKDGRIGGQQAAELMASSAEMQEVDIPIERTLDDGTRVINSTLLAKDVIGFGGRTPVEIWVREGVVERVEPLANAETPSFLNQVVRSGLLESWNGMPLEEAATVEVDMVSGATYTTTALIQNVQRAAAYGSSTEAIDSRSLWGVLDAKGIVGILVVLSGVIITFVRPKNRLFETLQLLLNVVVLGFWCGSFLSLSQFVSWISNGINLSISLVSVALLAVVLLLPLVGKKGSYCHIHCPMGSAQALLGKAPVRKWKLSQRASKILNQLRYNILLVLLFFMWLGVGFDLMNYEVFPAFLVSTASTVVLVMAALFLVLSLFITKPYCRFVCPTGALITLMQKTKE